MTIWYITKYASSQESGFESRPFALSRAFVRKGHDCAIISSDSNHFGVYPKFKNTYNFLTHRELRVLRIKTKKYINTASISRILSWFDFEIKLLFAPLNKFPVPDVIIVSSLSLITILNGIRLKRRYKAKLIFEIRDIWPLTMVVEGGFNKFNPFVIFLGWVERIGYLYSDLVVGTMPNLGEHVEHVTGRRNIRCECVPFGFDPVFYEQNPPNTSLFRQKYQIPDDKFVVGYAGSIGLSNGLEAFVESIEAMQSDSRILFLFLGDGALKKKYQEKTINCKNVIFLPKVSREEVSSFLSICDILYFSSLKSKVWEYGWSPNKLIDYMMACKPVLASYSGYKSMLNEADSGFFISAESSQEIIEALNNIFLMPKEDLIRLGQNGKSWVIKNRDWGIVSQNYLDLIKSLL